MDLSTWWVLEDFAAHCEIDEAEEDISVDEARQCRGYIYGLIFATNPHPAACKP
jgi:hypothetical protein